MVSRSVLRHFRISPYKVRLVLPLIKGKGVEEAFSILHLTHKRSAPVIAK
ncbi:MAG: uL22 family ribosomal protein, partial [Candidatus Dadabacteria bacterium]|nr:uL22 family ribosomal protein [Candidatus Dadabacteria bacterium]